MFTAKTRMERQKVLKSHFKFDCVCPACEEDWPTMKAMKNEENNFVIAQKSITSSMAEIMQSKACVLHIL
jgi:hypothetical protein